MQTLNKLIVMLLVLNIFMYLGVNFSMGVDSKNQLNPDYKFHFENDLLAGFLSGYTSLDDMTESTKTNWTDYAIGLNGNFTQKPTQQTGIFTSTGGIGFLDGLRIVWSAVETIGNIIIAPLTLFFNFHMPIFIGIMIGLPYFLILALSFFALIRGVGD